MPSCAASTARAGRSTVEDGRPPTQRPGPLLQRDFSMNGFGVILSALLVLGGGAARGQSILESRLVAPQDPIGYYDRLQEAVRQFAANRFEEAARLFQASVDEYP